MDITYLPMRRGAWHGLGPAAAHVSLYLVAIMDWRTRMDRAWRISNTLDADFYVEAMNEAIYRFGPPDIINMEHGRAIGPSGYATLGISVHIVCLDQPLAPVRDLHFDGR